MNKLPVSLDMDALRSFVTGIECDSFALAAQRLCRSTSAVSAQLKKLEAQCGTELVVRQGRKLALTPAGERLLSYARRLLALNDEAQRAVRGELLQGELRIGMQEDFGESLMPALLSQLAGQHPGLNITARIDRNRALRQAATEKQVDMALLWQPEQRLDESEFMGACPLVWIASPQRDLRMLLASGEPLPLVMFEAPCQMRSRAIAALDQAAIPWRVVFTSPSLSGIWVAVQAGLGITLRSPIGLPRTLHIVDGALPAAGRIGITLWQNRSQDARVQRLLHDSVSAALLPSLLR
ncbi:LysR substrate-binding domain-containing protein [Pantoea septica]|uniref:LysR substrate-binding domain-containing protein n=1 Tax=Pantoea septica TaxID=472695 RepID=UPI0023F20FA5|nr:LysR substrate-binding domain-containing protein [Pantoea septica]